MQPDKIESASNQTPKLFTDKVRKSRTATVIAIVASILVVGMVGVFVWGLMTDKIALTLSKQVKASVSYKVVCGDDLVGSFNDALYPQIRGNAKVPDIDHVALKGIATKVKGLKGYQGDPTCQTLIFWSDIYNADYDGAKTAEAAVKALHDQGKYPNNDISGNQQLSMYDFNLSTIRPEPKQNTK